MNGLAMAKRSWEAAQPSILNKLGVPPCRNYGEFISHGCLAKGAWLQQQAIPWYRILHVVLPAELTSCSTIMHGLSCLKRSGPGSLGVAMRVNPDNNNNGASADHSILHTEVPELLRIILNDTKRTEAAQWPNGPEKRKAGRPRKLHYAH